MDDNQLCGLYKDFYRDIQGTYTTLGISKLCEGLKGSAVTSLRRRHPECSNFVSAPLDTTAFSPSSLRPSPGSVSANYIGDQGASALAAVLKETRISKLECAGAPSLCSVSPR